MKITDIKQQVKRKDRYSVFVDGKYSFSLSEDGLLTQGLKIGKKMSDEELAIVKDNAIIDKGVYRVLDLISRRSRSRWEIEDYLKRKDYTPEEIDSITGRVDEKGYINDLDFAKRWIESRRLLKPTSKRKLTMELRQKRIAEDTIKQVLEDDPTSEQEVLEELIARKRRQTRYKDDQKLIAFLARQGFNYSDIKQAFSDRIQE
jgi:regulatory protein